MFDIGVFAYLRALFFWEFRRVWAGKRRLRKRILGQPPSCYKEPPSKYLSRFYNSHNQQSTLAEVATMN